MRVSLSVAVPTSLLLSVAGCGSEPVESESSSLGKLASAVESVCDSVVAAGDAWLNRPVPSSTGVVSASWRSAPSNQGVAGPIDAVIGFSSGPSAGFSDLGPIVRFGPNGDIDARDGGVYAGSFPYTFGDGPYEFQLLLDIPRHRYSAFVRHLDSPFKPFEILAQDFAFRTEQGSVAELDNLATIVDSAGGAVQNCSYAHNPPAGCVHSSAGSWKSRPFGTLGGQQVSLDFYAWVTAPDIDAVFGASLGAPARFADLAAIVRFRPDGYFDARNGGAYAADSQLGYVLGVYYRITLELDLALSTYSVSITPPGQNAVMLARDYAFRSEQIGVASLDHLGQFVDGTPGTAHSCALVSR